MIILDHLVLYHVHTEDKLFDFAIILFHNFYMIEVHKIITSRLDLRVPESEQYFGDNIVVSLGHYILSGATIPRRSNAFSRVILNEFTIQRREFSNFSSPNSKTLTCS